MQAMLNPVWAESSGWSCWHTGLLNWNYFCLTCHLEPSGHIRLGRTGKKLVAFGMLGEDSNFGLQAHPEYAGQGIETEALEWINLRIADFD